MTVIKAIVKYLIPNWLKTIRRKNLMQKQLSDWISHGKPFPPPHRVKQLIIEHYKKEYSINTLVETGTYLGDMVQAQLNNFNKIYSVELSEELWKKAVERFKKITNVSILWGDSGIILRSLVPTLNEGVIFWLDGHYSAGITAKGEKECPVFEELDSILESNYKHIILIDDAKLFVGKNDYPTLDELSQYVKSKRKNNYKVEDDVIRFELI